MNSTPSTDGAGQAPLVTASQLAEKYHVREKTIREYARRGVLPVVMLSARCLRFDPTECEPILNGSKRIGNKDQPRMKSTRIQRFNATVRPFDDPSRPHLKWVLNCYHPVKGRQRAFFKTKESAESEASARRIEFANYGLKATDLTSAQRIETIAALDSLKPFNVTITQVITEYIERRQGSMATFGEVAQMYQDSRAKLGRSARYLATIGPVYSRLTKSFGERRMSEISAVELQDWIESQEVGPQTSNHFRAMLNALFEFALRRKVVKENVIKDVERRRVHVEKVGILSVDQMLKLLAAAQAEPDVLATIAIGGFAGLRPDEIARLKWSALDFEHGQIDCGADITKTARHRYVKIEPVLQAWLLLRPRPPGHTPVQGENFRRRYEEVRKKAGFAQRGVADDLTEEDRSKLIPWPHDALRHSYASYHLAHFKNAAELALQLGHEGTKMLFQNYRARVADAAAAAWWTLFPQPGGEV